MWVSVRINFLVNSLDGISSDLFHLRNDFTKYIHLPFREVVVEVFLEFRVAHLVALLVFAIVI